MTSRSVASTAVGLALAAFLSTPAYADLVTFSNIVASWHDVAPPGVAGLNFQNNGSANPGVFWGVSLGQGQSGYTFLAAPNPFDVAVNPPPNSGDFDLGTFNHINHPISIAAANSSITGVQLSISADIAINGIGQGTRTFDFQFLHDETNNDANPCAFGGANHQGININGCADRVQVTGLSTSDTFDVGGVSYTLNILGFRSGGNFITDFLTLENAENPATIVADISVPRVAVPEPSTLMLIGGGLLWAGLFMRRKRGVTEA